MSDAAPSVRPESQPRGRRRSLQAQTAILSATCELLYTKCLRDITAEAIARRSGVSKATIYKWWPNKRLVALDAFLLRMTQDVPTPDTGSAKKDFTQQLQSVTAFYSSPAGKVFCQFIAEGQSDPAFLALFRERFLRSRRDEAMGMLRRGVERGDIRPDLDQETVLDLIYGPVIFRLLVGHGPLNDLEAQAVVATVFSGIAPTEG